jgi:ISXO2-like transposase domain
VPYIAAVSLDERGQPIHLKLSLVSGFTLSAISRWAQANLASESIVFSDGLGCFTAVADAGCLHRPRIVGALKPRNLPEFKWINTVLGNLKTSLAGAFHSLHYRKHATAYLARSLIGSTIALTFSGSWQNSSSMWCAAHPPKSQSSRRRLRHVSNQETRWRDAKQ